MQPQPQMTAHFLSLVPGSLPLPHARKSLGYEARRRVYSKHGERREERGERREERGERREEGGEGREERGERREERERRGERREEGGGRREERGERREPRSQAQFLTQERAWVRGDQPCSIRLLKGGSLFWFQVSVDDAETMEVIQCQRKLSQVELNIILSKHDLKEIDLAHQHMSIDKTSMLVVRIGRISLTSLDSLVKRSPPRRNSRTRYNLPSV